MTPHRLLYVEDDEDLRAEYSDVLQRAGFDTMAVSSAEEALEKLRSASFDVVVTDYNLTGENASWLLRHAVVEGLLDTTATVILTSERAPMGVEGFPILRKPVVTQQLIAAIRRAIFMSASPRRTEPPHA